MCTVLYDAKGTQALDSATAKLSPHSMASFLWISAATGYVAMRQLGNFAMNSTRSDDE